MIITAITKYQKHLVKSLFTTTKINKPKYSPPPSQFQDFKKHLQKIEIHSSKKQAAELLARLETDEEIYKEKLLDVEQKLKYQKEQNLGPILDLFNRIQQMEAQIESQTTENKQIEARCLKEIENIKIYGITKIAKEIIETVDHINQAINILNSCNNAQKLPQVTKLTRLLAEIHKLLNKYQIHQFNPINEAFNPNEQQSIGHITTEQPSKKNTVAQVKRTGFKIKERLLRSAFVIIYI